LGAFCEGQIGLTLRFMSKPMLQPLITSDGSPTLRWNEEGETYHSRHGAVTESLHVFIRAGLDQLSRTTNPIRVFEMGLGTGLNSGLAARWAEENQRLIQYTALERFPLPEDVWTQLSFSQIQPDWMRVIHSADFLREYQLGPYFSIRKEESDLKEFKVAASSADVVFYDAFGPRTQPELWTLDCFEKMFTLLRPGGLLVTYCAKGEVRRTMQSAGFHTERLPGPPGKREMLRAQKPTE
jgi:tRNA U34 5-methylaminomethyl-2-thiouridine-forming methyltransferase MnmC